MTRNQVLLEAGLYTLIGSLTPVLSVIAVVTCFDKRVFAVIIVAALIGGAAALKSFLSTGFADNQIAEGQTLKPSIKKK